MSSAPQSHKGRSDEECHEARNGSDRGAFCRHVQSHPGTGHRHGSRGEAGRRREESRNRGAAGAKTAKSAGGTKAKVSTANSATDDDSFWVEKLDVDGDGDVEDANLVWDDEDGILFSYTVGAFGCRNGGTATAELLIGINAAGNPRKRPTGSGFWLADLDKGECGAQAAAMWGCKFDASGAETACGVATLDEKTDDLVIVTAAK